MAQVSRRKIKEEKLERIFDLFFDVIVKVKDKKQADNVLKELLTPTERIMIAKRIACFYLIMKNVPSREIKKLISYSTSTAAYMKYALDTSKSLKDFIKKRMKDEAVINFIKDLGVELLYASGRKGSDWSSNKKTYYDYQRRRQEPI